MPINAILTVAILYRLKLNRATNHATQKKNLIIVSTDFLVQRFSLNHNTTGKIVTNFKPEFAFIVALSISGCSEGVIDNELLDATPDDNGQAQVGQTQDQTTQTPESALDLQLDSLLDREGLTGDPSAGLSLPTIAEPLSQLGMKLFYTKGLGGEMDSACVTCHHPSLGGTDQLSLSVGVESIDDELLGEGRLSLDGSFAVPRNAPTTFNSALYRQSLFWDSRVAQLDSGIRTPDSAFNTPDPDAGDSLLIAQARFPVTSVEEMKTNRFETDSNNDAIRSHLAARIGGYDGGFNAANELSVNNWLPEFQTAFGSSESAETLVTYENIAQALASYEASQLFINSPWKNYLDGDNAAISDDAKRGAILFFTPENDGGGDCSRCHSGDFFSDESHHVVAFPQIGPGKGDGPNNDDDFGLSRETGNNNDRYKFRTPSLLNISMTAPYGHTGAYQTLRDVVQHYDRPQRAVDFFDDNDWCESIVDTPNPQNCNALFPNAENNTRLANNALDNQPRGESINGINLNNNEVNQIVEFLETLTDPCIEDRECLSPWIPEIDNGPDGQQLNAVNQFGNRL